MDRHDLNPKSIKRSVYLKSLPLLIFCFSIATAHAQDDAVLMITGQTTLKDRAKGLGLNSGVKSVQWKEEPLEGVTIEVKKNGVTILKTTSGKKGKYSFQVPVSTTDPKNDYIVYFTKEGMTPKMIYVNAYLSKEEYKKYTSAKYDLDLDIPLLKTTVTDIVPEKPYAKIKWDNMKEHKFTLDPVYAKIAQSEEQKMMANPDQYYTSLAKKRKKAEEALSKNKTAADAKLKAIEDARLKAEEDARILADQKAKAEADRVLQKNLEAMKIEIRKKHIADSLAEVERKKSQVVASVKPEIKEVVNPVEKVKDNDEIKNLYDVSETYSINIARKLLSIEKEKRNKEKGKNLSQKYETINILTSLLNVVDEYDKKNKTQ